MIRHSLRDRVELHAGWLNVANAILTGVAFTSIRFGDHGSLLEVSIVLFQVASSIILAATRHYVGSLSALVLAAESYIRAPG